MAALTERDERLCEEAREDYSDLSAVHINSLLPQTTQTLTCRILPLARRVGPETSFSRLGPGTDCPGGRTPGPRCRRQFA
jgi:hypothetical protein